MSTRAVQEMLYGDIDPTSLLQRIAQRAAELIDAADGASVMMLSGGVLKTVAVSDDALGPLGRELSAQQPLAVEVFTTGMPFCCGDVVRNERVPVERRGNGRTRSV